MLLSCVLAIQLAVVGDGVPQPLTQLPGNAQQGRAIVLSRQRGLCLLCHSGPFPDEPVQATISTNLSGAGSRWSEAQLRLRVADARWLNPDSLMPSFHRLPTASRVPSALQDKPVLSAQEVEDVVAFLSSLR
ncbi:MAG: sulfur oxidation c-type cytochrome SoxX [Burkholderiales bacterium]|jgi:sulfur-oxidizing protein SoxX